MNEKLYWPTCAQVRVKCPWRGRQQDVGKGGRKRQMTDSKIESEKKLLANGVLPRDDAEDLGVSVPTTYRWLSASARL